MRGYSLISTALLPPRSQPPHQPCSRGARLAVFRRLTAQEVGLEGLGPLLVPRFLLLFLVFVLGFVIRHDVDFFMVTGRYFLVSFRAFFKVLTMKRCRSSVVERVIGNDEVASSILAGSTISTPSKDFVS